MLTYPDFPTFEPKGRRTWYTVTATLPDKREIEIGEWQGDPDAAGAAALCAYRRYHAGAYVLIMADGCAFAYVTHHPRTHEKIPLLQQPGFCAHYRCGEIPPEECFCAT
ncbi:hypothetical protein [Streptomyces sp. NPDC096153]|uniref:hypothetical protein n=1 Tax=Streptomyces sp. NPDC096153 TaxID=3155548 RepID=UPI0033281F5A